MWYSSSFKFERAILLYHIIAATLMENLLCASGTKSNLIFATGLAGRGYYCHAILQTGKQI